MAEERTRAINNIVKNNFNDAYASVMEALNDLDVWYRTMCDMEAQEAAPSINNWEHELKSIIDSLDGNGLVVTDWELIDKWIATRKAH